MKTLLIIIIALSISTTVLAQNPDKALTKVSYIFTHIQDTTQKDRPYTENMLLLVGKNASVYTSYEKINQTIALRKRLEEQMKNQAGSNNMNINLDNRGNKPTSSIDYFYFAKENKFYTKERVFNNYIVEEPTSKINWKITKDTISFSGIHCQKATTYFKGRNWIAWYATELPFQSGPWKLNGLPGLIIEAYDDTKTVSFQFAGMENVTAQDEATKTDANPVTKMTLSGTTISAFGIGDGGSASPYLGNEIKLPTDAIKATRKELDNLKEARDKDPQGFMKAQAAARNEGVISVVGYAMPKTTGPALAKIVLNNPIELPEKK
ncbi:GLPGLI family protein [Pedobacter polaris]|uniref:GLPGLI family protein n=1 Tax=Pedobacter polaris TaxID=2571273 RepID=A0A4U1CS49_9SPHI|nr:GLPGLI family protein [Pedobacter polaris]TKC10564.1 GLPGLI family protein [Pedobacter polaris]